MRSDGWHPYDPEWVAAHLWSILTEAEAAAAVASESDPSPVGGGEVLARATDGYCNVKLSGSKNSVIIHETNLELLP